MREKLYSFANMFVDLRGGHYSKGKRHYPLTMLSKHLIALLIVFGIIFGAPSIYWLRHNREYQKTVEALSVESTFGISAANKACGIDAVTGESTYSVPNSWLSYWTTNSDGNETTVASVVYGNFTYQGVTARLKVVAGPNGLIIEAESDADERFISFINQEIGVADITSTDMSDPIAEEYLRVVLEEVPAMYYAKVDTLGGPDVSEVLSEATVYCRSDYSFDWRTPWN